jgi:hypothetical protein
VAIVAVVAFGLGSLATAANGWRAFAEKEALIYQGGDLAIELTATPSLSGLGIRVSKRSKLSWILNCLGPDRMVRADQVVEVTLPASTACEVTAKATSTWAAW